MDANDLQITPGTPVTEDCGFEVYYSRPMGGSYGLVIVTHCRGIDGTDAVEYFICLSSPSGFSFSGRLIGEEIASSDEARPESGQSLAELAKLAAETAFSRFLLERGSATGGISFDPRRLSLQRGKGSDLLTLALQRNFTEFLASVSHETNCPKLRAFLKRVSGLSANSRAYGL
jgi:hypothetical protein